MGGGVAGEAEHVVEVGGHGSGAAADTVGGKVEPDRFYGKATVNAHFLLAGDVSS